MQKAKKSYQNDLASFQRVDTSDGLQSNKTITDEAQCSAATRNGNKTNILLKLVFWTLKTNMHTITSTELDLHTMSTVTCMTHY